MEMLFEKNDRENTVIEIKGVMIGEVSGAVGNFPVIAGPCSIESREQLSVIALGCKNLGIKFLRGGAFKPRTSPYDFQGMGWSGVRIMKEVCDELGMVSVSEVMDPRDVMRMAESIDILQIGARNMQNYPLLREVGKVKNPVLLKRGMGATLDEFLLAAEYILKEGNPQVILCERGIRTFERDTRNTLALASALVLKSRTHLPVIVDPSHGVGKAELVPAMSLAAVASGTDGVMLEVHSAPEDSLTDARQAISLEELSKVYPVMQEVYNVVNRI